MVETEMKAWKVWRQLQSGTLATTRMRCVKSQIQNFGQKFSMEAEIDQTKMDSIKCSSANGDNSFGQRQDLPNCCSAVFTT